LLDVAVGRARWLGQNGKITEYSNPALAEIRGPFVVRELHIAGGHLETPILIPGLVDVQRILDRLEKLDSGLHRVLKAEGRDIALYSMDPRLLPLDFQVALRRVAESVITAVLNMRGYKKIGERIGSLLATCNPRAFIIGADVRRQPERRTTYIMLYSCKSHMDGELMLSISIEEKKDRLGKSTWIYRDIDRIR
jgi:hypothetical protein